MKGSRLIGALAVAFPLYASTAVHAQIVPTQPSPSLAETLTAEAAKAYQSARLLFDDGDPAGALEKFKHAHDLSQDPRLLWNMAVCEKELRHYARSASLVRRYLKDGGDKVTAQSRADATDTEAALRGFYSLFTVEGAPAGARVLVDGEEVAKLPITEPVAVDLGPRVIRVEGGGYKPFIKTLDVPGNTTFNLLVRMQVEIASARLTVTSKGARDLIKIDGKTVATSYWQGTLTPGPHDLRVTADGKKPYLEHLLLPRQSMRTVSVVLEADEHKAVIWPWLVGVAGVASGLAVGGYLLLKPKEEQGSVPTGKLATVYIPAPMP